MSLLFNSFTISTLFFQSSFSSMVKSQVAAGTALPQRGTVLVTVNDYDKGAAWKFARDMHRISFKLYAVPGTAAIAMNVPLLTTLSPAMADVSAIQAMHGKELKYRSLQSQFANLLHRLPKTLIYLY